MTGMLLATTLPTSNEAAYGRSVVLLTAILGLLAATLVAFAVRCLVRGRYRDEEIDRRGSSIVIGNLARTYFAWIMQPVWKLLIAVGATPDGVTIASVPIAIGSAVAAGYGEFTLAGLLYLLSGMCDFLDGRLARITGRSSPAGAALDSVLDRYGECALVSGLAWYYRDSWVLAAALLLLSGSMLVPYIRARGEGLGLEVKTGLMQRPERVVLLGLATLLAPPLDRLVGWEGREPRYVIVAVCVTFLAVSTHATALTRLRYVVRALNERGRGETK
jgi:phosphatidylglycerophosphate synthase